MRIRTVSRVSTGQSFAVSPELFSALAEFYSIPLARPIIADQLGIPEHILPEIFGSTTSYTIMLEFIDDGELTLSLQERDARFFTIGAAADKISAIRYIRDTFKLSLRTAKDCADALLLHYKDEPRVQQLLRKAS